MPEVMDQEAVSYISGPVGVDGLLTMKWKLVSENQDGDIVKEYTDKTKPYLHERIQSKL